MKKNKDGIERIKGLGVSTFDIFSAWNEYIQDEAVQKVICAKGRLQSNVLLRKDGWQYLSTPMMLEVVKLARLNKEIEQLKEERYAHK